jgi:hypothetical protein
MQTAMGNCTVLSHPNIVAPRMHRQHQLAEARNRARLDGPRPSAIEALGLQNRTNQLGDAGFEWGLKIFDCS